MNLTIFDHHDRLTNLFKTQSVFDLKRSLDYDSFCEGMRFNPDYELDGIICYFWNSFSLDHSLFGKAKELMIRKNHDYAGEADPFKNFRMCEEVNLCTVLVGMLVRLGDKVSRLENLKTKEAKVKEESIEDTLIDVINYCVLIRAYLEGEVTVG